MVETAPSRAKAGARVEDVAALAGVSVATVSRALRGLPNVALATRERVRAAAEELRYRPDPNASRLAAGRSHAIGVVVPVIGQWYFGQVLAGVEAVLAPAGFDLLVYTAPSPLDRRRFLDDASPMHKRVDGLVLVDFPIPEADLASWARTGVHLVTIGRSTSVFPSVSIDERAAAASVVQHLLGLGHRRIGLIGGGRNEGAFRSRVPTERRAGYRAALRAAGVAASPELEARGGFTVDDGRVGMDRLLAAPEPPTAVFAIADEMAVGAWETARRRGLRVPDDVSIVGFDDHEMAAPLALTTVRQPVADIGAAAARLLVDGLAGPVAPGHVVLPTELVVRGTTAVAPRRWRR
jgi:LacI family repressor for deo operon, udp, cdd, tsx, nupC, and nupG